LTTAFCYHWLVFDSRCIAPVIIIIIIIISYYYSDGNV